MGMFSNYENLNPQYHPDNRWVSLPTDEVVYQYLLPYADYDICGGFEGYSWNYGDCLTLRVDINPIVKVEASAIIYTEAEEMPTESTVGYPLQKAYNVSDMKVWRCVSDPDQSVYSWELVEPFKIPKNPYPCQPVRLKIHKDIAQASGKANIRNFRMEIIHTVDVQGADTIEIEIDKELSEKLVKGNYFCDIELSKGDNDRSVIYYVPLFVK